MSAGPSSGYDRLAETLVREGTLHAGADREDFERYMHPIRYWTGSGWTKKSATNAR